MKSCRQPWLANPWQESVFILAPALLPVLVIFLFQDYFVTGEVTTFWWVALVLCVDVSHVYSTLFRLYWDRPTFTQYKRILILIPVAGFAAGLALHYYDNMIFWRVLAYIAVYHFIRQQYGFMRLYSRKEKSTALDKIIDNFVIYNATIFPLLYWHIHATGKLAWFVKGDFISIPIQEYEIFFRVIYAGIILLYVIRVILVAVRDRFFNIPKNLIIVGTYVSWYVGIVAFQADLIFTLLNVVAHGIPYMALIWLHGQKKSTKEFSFNVKGVVIFVAVLLVLAYVEENFWDTMIWQDHQDIFPLFSESMVPENPLVISIVVALLVLPQLTHYVLDGFIWRFSKDTRARVE